jgi:hypothetical protein
VRYERSYEVEENFGLDGALVTDFSKREGLVKVEE